MIASFLYPRLKIYFSLLIALISTVDLVCAQTSPTLTGALQARITRTLQLIRIAEQQHLPEEQQGILWTRLALEYHVGTDFTKAENAYIKALHLLKTAPSARAEYAATLDDLASLYLSYGRSQDAESLRKQVLKEQQKLGNPMDIAVAEVHLADIALARRQFKKAEQIATKGLKEMESSSNPPPGGLLSGSIVLTYARCNRSHCDEGMANAKQAIALANKYYASEPAALAFALETLGFAEWKTGATQAGEKDMLRAIQMLRTNLAPADPRLAGAMLQYKAYLVEAKRQAEAQEIGDQVARMTSRTGAFCPGCTVSVSSLSNALR